MQTTVQYPAVLRLALNAALNAALPAVLLSAAAMPLHAQMTDSDGTQRMRQMMQRMMAERLPPGLDPALLPDHDSEGARVLQRYCAQCHALPGPGMHTADEWPATLQRMEAHMSMHSRMMGGIAIPDAIELEDLLAYLQANALNPIDPAHPGVDTPRGGTFRATCAQCHALPDPAQHAPAEWPAVVARMQRNMAAMRRPQPDPAAIQAIIDFLQEHARPPARRLPDSRSPD